MRARTDLGPAGRAAAMAALMAAAAALGGCASAPPEPSCQGGQLALHDALYFGTATPRGTVSADDWSDFLRHTVTPRFPQGLSAWPAAGQWRGADGRIVHEASHVLTLVHPADGRSERALAEIVALYKARFEQEAVLRVQTRGCMSL